MKYIFIIALIFSTLSINAQLNPDRHTTSPSDSWKSCIEALNPNGVSEMSHWVKFDFESIYNLGDIKIWNLNDPATLTDGISQLRIDYSVDNSTWVNAGTFTVPVSNGSAFYEGDIIGTLNGAQAKHLILTAEDNHGGTCYGFSEARFYLGTVVPVELANFDVNCEDNKMELNWEYGDVSDFDRTEVEWSRDGENWESIFTTDQAGDQKEGLYSNTFTDIRYHSNVKNYYRLKIYDLNGKSEYSNIESSSCEFIDQDITIYPQPARAEMFINIELSESNLIDYTIFNILGQQMDQNVLEGREGMNQFKIDVNGYVSGQYVVRFEIGGEYIEKKFIKK